MPRSMWALEKISPVARDTLAVGERLGRKQIEGVVEAADVGVGAGEQDYGVGAPELVGGQTLQHDDRGGRILLLDQDLRQVPMQRLVGRSRPDGTAVPIRRGTQISFALPGEESEIPRRDAERAVEPDGAAQAASASSRRPSPGVERSEIAVARPSPGSSEVALRRNVDHLRARGEDVVRLEAGRPCHQDVGRRVVAGAALEVSGGIERQRAWASPPRRSRRRGAAPPPRAPTRDLQA